MGFQKKRATTSTRSIMLGMRVEVECYWGYGASLPRGGALQSELGDLGEQREGISRGSEACRCIERHLEWQD